MEKDSFFDTSVVINYASFSKQINHKINNLCFDYVHNKKGRYILCYYVRDEILNRIKKRKIIHQEVISKLKDIEYNIGGAEISKSLSGKDIIQAKKLYELHKNNAADKVSDYFLHERIAFEKKIEFFLETLVNEMLLEKGDIDTKIVNLLYETINEFGDCRVLASALQIQKERPVFFLVTVDKEHFNPNDYSFIKEDHRFKDYKFPELNNLLYNQ